MPKTIDVAEFDRKFDDGEDVSKYVEWSSADRPGLVAKRVRIDMPQHMVAKLDTQARKRGVTLQALIKVWLGDRLEAVGCSDLQ